MKYRSCGDCTVCCTALEIPELSKPTNLTCKNVCKGGCSIYESRPASCKLFQCLWSSGIGGIGQRPDKSGIMAYNVTSDFGNTLLILEVKPGAFYNRSSAKEKLVKYASKTGQTVFLVDHDHKATAIVER